MQRSLTEEVLDFQRTGRDWDGLFTRLAVEVYTYPRRWKGLDEDDCSDFYCLFYPELRGLVTRFVYRGRPFEVYLRVTMKWRLRSFSSRCKHTRLCKRVLEEEISWASEGEPRYENGDAASPPDREEVAEQEASLTAIDPTARRILRIDGNNRISDRVIRKRVLFLAMMGAATMTQEMIARVAYLTGENVTWLEDRFNELRARIAARHRRVEHLRERRNLHFFRICCIQAQISAVEDVALRRGLFEAMIREKTFLANTLEEISRVRAAPAHSDIADILGVPKGSVDSGLFYLRNSLAVL